MIQALAIGIFGVIGCFIAIITERFALDALIIDIIIILCPNLGKNEGGYWFGPVRPSVRANIKEFGAILDMIGLNNIYFKARIKLHR